MYFQVPWPAWTVNKAWPVLFCLYPHRRPSYYFAANPWCYIVSSGNILVCMGYVFNPLNIYLCGILGSHDTLKEIMKPLWRPRSGNLEASPGEWWSSALVPSPAPPQLFPGPSPSLRPSAWASFGPGELCFSVEILLDGGGRKTRWWWY